MGRSVLVKRHLYSASESGFNYHTSESIKVRSMGFASNIEQDFCLQTVLAAPPQLTHENQRPQASLKVPKSLTRHLDETLLVANVSLRVSHRSSFAVRDP